VANGCPGRSASGRHRAGECDQSARSGESSQSRELSASAQQSTGDGGLLSEFAASLFELWVAPTALIGSWVGFLRQHLPLAVSHSLASVVAGLGDSGRLHPRGATDRSWGSGAHASDHEQPGAGRAALGKRRAVVAWLGYESRPTQ
jgi:hypothetical protein